MTGRSVGVAATVAILLSATAWNIPTAEAQFGDIPGRVVVIGIAGVNWEDIEGSDSPAFRKLMKEGLRANVTVRANNSPDEAYATLGAGRRVQVDTNAALAFNALETVENGSAAAMHERRTGRPPRGLIVVPGIEALKRRNSGRGFDATPGLLGGLVRERRGRTAVVGNADTTLDPDLSLINAPALPGSAPDLGVHREAALAVMSEDGVVAAGNVGPALLVTDSKAPFGLATDQERLLSEFKTALALSQMVVVETGDTRRADLYSVSFPEAERDEMRAQGLVRAGKLIEKLLAEVDLPATLVVVMAPTTPGGPLVRGHLRPALILAPHFRPGLATSASTRRDGLIWMADITAEAARFMGLPTKSIGGNRIEVVSSGGSLKDMNGRAVVHDKLRAVTAVSIITAEVLLYVIALWQLRSGRIGKSIRFLLLAALAFPLASFTPHFFFWRAGTGVAALSIVAAALAVGAVTVAASRGSRRVADFVLFGTWSFFIVDLLLGARAQQDSVFGNTSVAAGRFYGLGNLGFALVAGSCLVCASTIWSRFRPGTYLMIGLTVIAVGFNGFGGDVGGTLALIPAGFLLIAELRGGRRASLKNWGAGVVAAMAALTLFAILDLTGRGSPSHLGRFLQEVSKDPGYFFVSIKRKAGFALDISTGSAWGLAVPIAVAVGFGLYKLAGEPARQLWRDSHIGAGLRAVVVAAVLGSLLNDSGLAVGGMMVALVTPWMILTVSERLPSREKAKETERGSGLDSGKAAAPAAPA